MAETSQQPANTPPILYKYRMFDPRDLQIRIIEKAELWFTSAHRFNDPFDSSLSYDFGSLDLPLADRWAEMVTKREHPTMTDDECHRVAVDQMRHIRSNRANVTEFNDYHVEANYAEFGVCCLTTHPLDLLMWAHYADSHSGFCVGIDTQQLLTIQNEPVNPSDFLDLWQVTYADEPPKIDFFESMLSDKWSTDIMRLLATKSKQWEYEQEFRLFYHRHIDSPLTVGFGSITEIILGLRISSANRARVLNAINRMGLPTKVFQASKDGGQFRLKLHQIQ